MSREKSWRRGTRGEPKEGGKKENKEQGQEEEKDPGEMSTADKKKESEETGKRRVKGTNAKGRVFICMSHGGKGMGGCD